MPPKKKKGFSNAKKKRGARGSNSNHVGDTHRTSRNNKGPFRNLGNLPIFHGAHRGEGNDSGGSGDYYETYKRATTQFCKWMKEMSLIIGMERMQSVNDLHKGASAVLSRNTSLLTSPPPPDPIVAPPEIMMALETGIQYREMFTRNTFGSGEGGDVGHRYMMGVLRLCHATLTLSRKVARVVLEAAAAKVPDDETKDEVNRIGGRFHALLVDFEEEEEGEHEEQERIRRGDLPTLDVSLPPAPEEDIDIERDLIHGDDHFQAVALLHTMDQLMGAADAHYSILKNYLRRKEQLTTYTSPVQFLLECAATTNLAVQSVRAAEAALVARHPHLSSFYHVLALVFLPSRVADVERLMGQQKRHRETRRHQIALDFTASIVECSFHNWSNEQVVGRVKRHAKKMGVPLAALESKAKLINYMMSYEALLAMEQQQQMDHEVYKAMRESGVEPHSWLNASRYIGNDRCILNTQKILQRTLDFLPVQDGAKLVYRSGIWGHEFEEFKRPAETIRGGLDEVLGGQILPELLAISQLLPLARLPEVARLMPVISLLHDHLHQGGGRTRPVPVALTFGLHAALTSIFVLQGAGDLARVADLGKRSYGALFGQLETIADPSRSPENAPIFYKNVEGVLNIANFAQPVSSEVDSTLVTMDPEQTEQLAFWNPVVGGGYLLCGTYYCSVGLGSATVDSLGQLRFTLHLYNALKRCNSTTTDVEVPLLEQLQATFSQTKAVWLGGHPDKGSFCKHFWMAWGMSIARAAQIAAEGPVGNDGLAAHLWRENTRSSELTRKVDEINPGEFSASYKRVVEQNFTNDKDGAAGNTFKGATKEARKRYSSLIDLLTRVTMTKDSMDKDEDFVMHTNFPAVGCILLEYTNSLSEHMGWNAVLDQFLLQFHEALRTGKIMGGSGMKLGSFRTSDLNLRHQALAHLWGNFLAQIDASTDASLTVDRAAKFTADFFKDRDKAEYSFFAPCQESQEM